MYFALSNLNVLIRAGAVILLGLAYLSLTWCTVVTCESRVPSADDLIQHLFSSEDIAVGS
jgi:hypothetical protein